MLVVCHYAHMTAHKLACMGTYLCTITWCKLSYTEQAHVCKYLHVQATYLIAGVHLHNHCRQVCARCTCLAAKARWSKEMLFTLFCGVHLVRCCKACAMPQGGQASIHQIKARLVTPALLHIGIMEGKQLPQLPVLNAMHLHSDPNLHTYLLLYVGFTCR